MNAGPVSWTTTHGDKVEVWSADTFFLGVIDGLEWRWRRKARNGRIIATSGESYVKRARCLWVAGRINPKVET